MNVNETVRDFVRQRTTGRGVMDILNETGSLAVKGLGAAGLVTCGAGFAWASFIENTFGPEEVLPMSMLTCLSGGFVTYLGYQMLANGGLDRLVTMGQFGDDNPPAGGHTPPPNNPRPGHPAPMPQPTPQPAVTQPFTPPTGRPIVAGQSADPAVLTLLADSLHLLVIGHTGGGKTTLYHALTAMWVKRAKAQPDPKKRGLVVVLDPDAAAGLWPGCRVYGAGSNYAQIEKVTTMVGQLFLQRSKLYGQGVSDFPDLWVVIDEYAAVSGELPLVKKVVEGILRRGRKLGIHLMLGVQDKQMHTMNMKGQTKLMNNFTFVCEAVKDSVSGHRSLIITDGYGGNRTEYPTPRLPDPNIYKKRVDAPNLPPLWEQIAIGEGDNEPPADDDEDDWVTPQPRPDTSYTTYTSAKEVVQEPENTMLNYQTPEYEAVRLQTPPQTPVFSTSFDGKVVQGIIPPADDEDEQIVGDVSAMTRQRINELLADTDPSMIDGITVGEHKAISFLYLNGLSNNKIMGVIWRSKNAKRNEAINKIKENLEKLLA